jgi:hypothetical protein
MFDGNTFSNIFVPLVTSSVQPFLLLTFLLKNLILKYRAYNARHIHSISYLVCRIVYVPSPYQILPALHWSSTSNPRPFYYIPIYKQITQTKVAYFWKIYYLALATKWVDATTTQLRASVGLLWMQETEIQAFHPSIANISSHKQWLQWTSCRIVQRPY